MVERYFGSRSIKIIIGICVALTLFTRYIAWTENEDDMTSTQLNQATIWMLGVLTWIFIFEQLFGLQMINQIPILFVALAWPIVLLVFELYLTSHQTLSNESKRSRGTLQMEISSISGLAFALGGVLMTNLGKTFSKTLYPLLSIVILICLIFIIPNPSTHFGSSTGAAIQTCQKVCLLHCLGILIGAVLVNLDLTRALDWKSAHAEYFLTTAATDE